MQGVQLDLQNKAADAQGKQARAAKDQMDAVLKAQEAHAKDALLAAAPFHGLVALSDAEQAFQGGRNDQTAGF
jgi:hypothetical protein